MAGRYAAEARACRHAAAQSAAEDEAQDAPATTWQSCGRAPHAGRRRGCRLAQEPGAARCAAGSVDSACRRAVALHHRQRRAAPKQASSGAGSGARPPAGRGGRAPPPAAAAKRAARLSEAELRRFRDVAFGGCD
ncbi:unnamed protein product [Prorocentrum cordatum]|uniref:Uncharacterized protein n=1 Tax=Prorocentrum cordatum TaxID=2364126 RepID=A0ABN9PUT1_9DINO|nr:unnamed protein product [Polarella glacialis]